MRFAFASKKLEQLYTSGKGARKLPPEIVSRFNAVVDLIRQVPHEQHLYQIAGHHLEKLKGDRQGQYSLRLNDQFRLCFEILKDKDGNIIVLIEIVDYH